VYRIAEPVRGHRDSRKSRRPACIACVLVSASDDGNTSRAAPRSAAQRRAQFISQVLPQTASQRQLPPPDQRQRSKVVASMATGRSSQATTCSWDKRPHTMRRACDSVYCPGDLQTGGDHTAA